jgi:hypothetical protein
MIYRISDERIAEYYATDAINQSALKAIIKDGVQCFLANKEGLLQRENELYYEEKEHFLIGSAVDYFITAAEQRYNAKYHFSRLDKKPKDTPLSIIHQVFDKIKAKHTGTIDGIWEFDMYLEEIYDACNEHKYFMNRKKTTYQEDTRFKELLKSNAKAYWEELKQAGNKIILSDAQNQKINTMTNSLLYHPFTRGLFRDGDGIDIIFQMPIYFYIDGVKCKALLDELYINHNTKLIIPLDIKTTKEHISNFNKDIKYRRYDVQASFYSNAIKQRLNLISEEIGKDIMDYTVDKFGFIAESTTSPGTPLKFPLSSKLLDIGRNGDSEEGILGWRQALDLYITWNDADFKLDKILKESNGVLFVDENYDYQLNF